MLFRSPETFSCKFFPKFFLILPRRLFAVFLVRKIMGVEGTCRSPNRGGGVPFCRLSLYTNRHTLTQGTSSFLRHSKRTKGHQNRAKQGKSKHLFGALWCFLGIFGDRKRQNTKIFLKCGCKVGAGGGSACLPSGVSAGVSGQALGAILLTLAR